MQRLFYLDAARGLAMLLVVLGHVSMYRGGFMEFFPPFALPLFMMVSGMVTNPDKVKITKRLKLLIPFFIFGITYSYLCYNSDVIGFICDLCKNGYWFLWEIIIFNIFIWGMSRLRINIWTGFVCLEFISLALYFILLRHSLIGNILGVYYWCFLLPFFILGILLRKIGMERLAKSSTILYPCCGIMIILLWGLLYVIKDNYWLYNISQTLTSFPICIIILLYLYKLEVYNKGITFMGKGIIKKIGIQIGQYTLEIYVLHYFVLYYMQVYILRIFIPEGTVAFEYFLGAIVTIIVSYICIFIANVCKKARLSIVFGR